MKWSVIVLLLLVIPAHAEPAGAIERIQRWLWPNAVPATQPAPPVASLPPPAVSPPPVPKTVPAATPKAAPKPKPKAAPPKVVVSAAECAELADGIRFVGVERVKREARKRGLSEDRINGILKACGYK